jgi:hypothetical protein
MVVTFKTIYLTPKSQVHTVALPYSPQLSIWMLSASLYDQNRYSYPIWPKFGPNLVQLTHFVTGVGSSNLIYALTVLITFRNVLWPKVAGLYFQNWLLWANLAQIWSNLVHLKTCKGWHYVSGTLEVLMTLKNMLRLRLEVPRSP